MAINPNTTVRKNVSLSRDLAERVERFRTSRGLTAESDALRRLIEIGLGIIDEPEDLFERCKSATESGNTLGDIVNVILNDHPLIAQTTINNDRVVVYLKNRAQIVYIKSEKKWEYIEDEDFDNGNVPF